MLTGGGRRFGTVVTFWVISSSVPVVGCWLLDYGTIQSDAIDGVLLTITELLHGRSRSHVPAKTKSEDRLR